MPIRPASSVLRKLTNPSPRVPSRFSLRNDGVLEDQLAGVAGPPAHLVFLLARPEPGDLRQIGRVADAEPWRRRSRSTVSLVTMKLVMPLLPGPGVGAGGDGEDLADAGMGDEDLGAVQDEMVALVDGGGGRPAGVAAGARLGQAEPAQHLAGGEQRDVPPLLLLGPEFDDGRGAQVGMGADGERVAGIDLGQLVDGDVVGELVHPGPAELLRPGHAEQAEFAHFADVVPGKFRGAIEFAGDRGHLLPGELADHVAHLLVLLAEVEREIHDSTCVRVWGGTRLAPPHGRHRH